MARLVLIGGPPGVGKSITLRLLVGRFPKSAVLDADDVWRVSDDIKDLGVFWRTAVASAIRNYFGAGCELVVVSWVFARADLFQPVIDAVGDVVDHSHMIYLVADPESLERRLIERGDPERLAYAKTRLELIEQLPFPKIDTSNISAELVADRVADKIREWGVGVA